ncbi:MAG: Rpn family recombination-promoting nuclease/putative transposase [Spirulinaceae cyanobacterium]
MVLFLVEHFLRVTILKQAGRSYPDEKQAIRRATRPKDCVRWPGALPFSGRFWAVGLPIKLHSSQFGKVYYDQKVQNNYLCVYDNFCKYLIETYPEDFATWLIGKPVSLTQLKPTELISEPIRADSLMLQGHDVVLHVEFQTRPDAQIPERLANYYLRIRRKFPKKRIVQVVLYLCKTGSPLVKKTVFRSGGMTHKFRVIRLWEQPKDVFWDVPGLLPLAILSKAADQDAVALLERLRLRITEVTDDVGMQGNLEAATAMLAGLKLEAAVIKQIMRSRAMRESTFYQDLVQENFERGRQEGRRLERVFVLRTILPILKQVGFPVERILSALGMTLAEIDGDDQQEKG